MNLHNRLFSIYTKNNKYFMATMMSCIVALTLQTTEAFGEPDRFEPNDSSENANLIIIESSDTIDPDGFDYAPPTFRYFRNFHSDIDTDWVAFFAQKDKSYTISIEAVNNNTDVLPDYTLFLLNGNQLDPLCEPIRGGVGNDVDCPIFGKGFNPIKEGFYFIKLENSNPEVIGDATSYAIRIGGQFGDHILGIVRDAKTGEPIIGATITMEGSTFNPVQSQGSPKKGLYSQLLPPVDSLILVATYDGYLEFRTEVTDTSQQVDIDMLPVTPDLLEPDDTSENANLIIIGSGERPLRNFHSETDIDWVVFFAQKDEFYTIDISPAGNNANLLPDYTLFYLNGNQIVQLCETIRGGFGEEVGCPVSGSDFNPSEQGFYLIKLTNSNSDVTGDGTSYTIGIPGDLTGEIQGVVRNANTGEPIVGAAITIEGANFSPILSRGSPLRGLYSQLLPPLNSLILVATHEDYLDFRREVTDNPVQVDIDMVPAGLFTIHGTVSFNGTAVCAMVLANGQYMFTCGADNGVYELDVPLDDNGEITVQAFVSGLAPYRMTTNAVDLNMDIDMQATSQDSQSPVVTATVESDASTPVGWARISGTVTLDGTPLCAMVLANGQFMFSCNANNGIYNLSVPLNSNGEIILFVFVSGLQPYRQIFTP